MRNKYRIKNSYAAGAISGDSNTGGLVGYNEAYVNYSYYDKDTTEQDDEGKGIPKTTQEMIQHDTFTPEWDFDTKWDIDEGDSYPYLQWQEDENIPYPPE